MSENLEEKAVSQQHKPAQTAELFLRSLLDGAPDTALIAPDFEYEQHFGFTAVCTSARRAFSVGLRPSTRCGIGQAWSLRARGKPPIGSGSILACSSGHARPA